MNDDRRSKSNKELLFYQSWADMVALLLVFFVFLFSMSTLDIVKFRELTSSFVDIFNVEHKEKMMEKYLEEQKILTEILQGLQAYIEKENLYDVVSVKMEEHTIVMDLGSGLLFQVAHANLKPQAEKILLAFAEYFKQIKRAKIIVEGHTDDIPIKKKEYPSNWELSAARAASVVRYLGSQGIDESNCYIIGYNQYNPLVQNDSRVNRAKNRRVRIIFKPDVHVIDEVVDFSSIMNEDDGTEIIDVSKDDEIILEE